MGEHRLLGLALGGGGVRGGAHIGLLKVLEREGVAIGPIAGTSAGAIVGGLYAAGLPAAEIEDLLLSIEPAQVLVVDTSGWALLSTRHFADILRRRTGDPRIEDLPHPFAAVAVDLRRAQEVRLDAGPLVRAIQASIAVPGLLCPVEHDGCLLVDGGVLNNVPVDVVRALGAGRVLAMDVGVPPDLPLEISSFAGLPGAGPRLVERILRVTGRQGAASALTKSWDILCAATTARRLQDAPPDLLLRPDLGPTPVTALERLAEMIAAGERVAAEQLPHILALLQ